MTVGGGGDVTIVIARRGRKATTAKLNFAAKIDYHSRQVLSNFGPQRGSSPVAPCADADSKDGSSSSVPSLIPPLPISSISCPPSSQPIVSLDSPFHSCLFLLHLLPCFPSILAWLLAFVVISLPVSLPSPPCRRTTMGESACRHFSSPSTPLPVGG